MTENIGVIDQSTHVDVMQDKAEQVRVLGASDEFIGLPPDLKNAAIGHALFFIGASESEINKRIGNFRAEAKAHRWSFAAHDEEANGQALRDIHDKMFDDTDTTGENRAKLDKELRVEAASRIARDDAAELLGYSRQWLTGEYDDGSKYDKIIKKEEFKKTDKFVKEAVEKFS